MCKFNDASLCEYMTIFLSRFSKGYILNHPCNQSNYFSLFLHTGEIETRFNDLGIFLSRLSHGLVFRLYVYMHE